MEDTLEALGLPSAAVRKLASHPYGGYRLLDALSHPLRRQIIREIHFADTPRTVRELRDGHCGQIRSAEPRAVEYHVGILVVHRVLKSVSEIATGRGLESSYLSAVAGDATVTAVLVETAELDLRWNG